jgi:hypothetical protein
MSDKKQIKAYTVKKDDTLSAISLKLFKDASLWRTRLQKENGDTFTEEEAKKIRPKQQIYYYEDSNLNSKDKRIEKKLEDNNQKSTNAEHSNITHRELLTFSNLTHLEWQFVSLSNESEDNLGRKIVEYKKLNDLLSDPASFVRYDADTDSYSYPYLEGKSNLKGDEGKNIQLTDEEKEEGLIKLRQNAGIAMEYLEKSKGLDEAKFIQDWEVVYAADNYKVVADYLDYEAELCAKFFDFDKGEHEKPYPSRKKVEQNQEKISNIKATFAAANIGLSIGYWNGGLKGATKSTNKEMLKAVINKLIKKEARSSIENLAEYTDSSLLKIMSTIYFTRSSAWWVTQDLGKELTTKQQKGLEKEISADDFIKFLKERKAKIELTERLEMFDTGFRVVAFKKGDTIVISYKGKKADNNKILPQELDYLKIVYSRLKREHSDAKKIIFTGYEGGANLSFINTLAAAKEDNVNATLFYSSINELKGYIDFTCEDVDKEYKSNIEVIVLEAKGIGKQAVEKAFYAFLIAALVNSIQIGATVSTLMTAYITALAWGGISFIKSLFKKVKIEDTYNKLEAAGFIKKEEKGIRGYITDKLSEYEFPDNKYLLLDVNSDMSREIAESVSKNSSKEKDLKIENDFSMKRPNLNSMFENKIKVKKEHAVYLILNNDELNIIENPYRNDPRYHDIEYMVNISSHLIEKSFGEDPVRYSTIEGRAARYWRLVKNENDIYEIRGLIQEDSTAQWCDHFQPLMAADKEKIEQVEMLVNLMEITSNIQRNYLNYQERIEAVYCNPEAMYDDDQENIRISSDILKLAETNKSLKRKALDFLDPPTLITNEFIFMPYIGENGYIDSQNPKLRPEYKASVFKSMVQKYLECEKYQHYKSIMMTNMKYDSSEVPLMDYSYDFGETDMNEEFLKMMKEVKAYSMDEYYGKYETKILFNHYKTILEELKENPQILEDYYQEEERKEEKLLFLRDINAEINLNPLSSSTLEYKYNPLDEIVGGVLELYAEDIPETEEEIKEDRKERISAITNAVFWGKEKANKIIEEVSEEAKEKVKFLKDEADKIYDHTLEELKVAKEEFSQSDEIKEEEVSVGRKYNDPGKEKGYKAFNNIIAH